jgi:hypothetical protein
LNELIVGEIPHAEREVKYGDPYFRAPSSIKISSLRSQKDYIKISTIIWYDFFLPVVTQLKLSTMIPPPASRLTGFRLK